VPTADSKFLEALDRAHETACAALLAERCAEGYWLGELSSSALATATAVSALSIVRDSSPQSRDQPAEISNLKSEISNLISRVVGWLAEHQNEDGGWGDTTRSFSNISTTMLVRASFSLAGAAELHAAALDRATAYIDKHGGAAAVAARYGKDRTFAVPILANCALAGQADWRDVAPLPFELAALPHGVFRFLRLHVVSYALPALIAIGQLIHAKRPTWNPLARLLRRLAIAPTLRKLEAIQPTSGGFLEAIPLTSFVVMSLAAAGHANHAVVMKGIEFLIRTARPDGSWPIDSNLSIWLTTLSVNALANAPSNSPEHDWLQSADAIRTRDWLLAQQQREVHRYTNAAPGGWGWSHLSGSVPDADDTAGALLALMNLPRCKESGKAELDGFRWLEQLQNWDGGWPTFCRGWGKLPFDRSGPDLTAHVIRALCAWARDTEHSIPVMHEHLGWDLNCDFSHSKSFRYLEWSQRADGSWIPLWFGNQFSSNDENRTYGTARVALAFQVAKQVLLDPPTENHAGEVWLVAAQNADGGWGGQPDTPSSVEETGLAVEALAGAASSEAAKDALIRGVAWLIDRVESGNWRIPSPIGLYFAKLWYFEKLYPLIFTTAALGRARQTLNPQATPPA